ncbi:MAG: hypothetical protein M1824_001435 [Vezdaea acicularis]|nr:MAG: hypothetical protein M1824_001435 [Vezdaea acicularis]
MRFNERSVLYAMFALNLMSKCRGKLTTTVGINHTNPSPTSHAANQFPFSTVHPPFLATCGNRTRDSPYICTTGQMAATLYRWVNPSSVTGVAFFADGSANTLVENMYTPLPSPTQGSSAKKKPAPASRSTTTLSNSYQLPLAVASPSPFIIFNASNITVYNDCYNATYSLPATFFTAYNRTAIPPGAMPPAAYYAAFRGAPQIGTSCYSTEVQNKVAVAVQGTDSLDISQIEAILRDEGCDEVPALSKASVYNTADKQVQATILLGC